jgi:hypothetical protein
VSTEESPPAVRTILEFLLNEWWTVVTAAREFGGCYEQPLDLG